MSLSASASFTIKYKDKSGKVSDRTTKSFGLGKSGDISFLNPTYTPQNSLPYSNFNFSGSFKIGGAVLLADLSGTIAGFYSEQSLMTNTMSNPGYGYIYSEKGQFVDNATHDFNREKDGPYTSNLPALPLTNYTYDAFNIKAQGIGGSFRGFRNDMGHLFDPEMTNPSAGGSFGAELDLGNAVDFGLDINVNWNESKSGKWKDDNMAVTQMKFTEPETNSLYENVFFKMVGEKVSETDNGYMDRIQHEKAVAVELEEADHPAAYNRLISDNSTTIGGNNFRNKRMIRNNSVQCFTVADVKRGFPIYAKYLPAEALDHHIAMIVVLSPDGTRYVFGLPAYNKVKREVTMAVGGTIDGDPGLSYDPNTNLLQYTSTDASIGNQKGIDNYYDKTETPAFVHTWYLTEVLSPDYSDLTGDGATPDDLGGYVKFTYGIDGGGGTVLPNIQDYKWRTPSNDDTYQATYSQGLRTITTDDKATYLYGEKDIWYPNTIESKTQLVKFEYDDRGDGFGVTSEHGVVGGDPQQLIKKIFIYSRQDYAANSTSAVPLKTIHFEYDYSLCPGVYNNMDSSGPKGKLTLKKVFFTYRNSSKAKYSSYTFEYPTGDLNPAYNPTANDRWGGYRPNTEAADNEIPRNEEYPYVKQDTATANEYARCWNLKAIDLPTGGKINIEYESDDYAYVQDRKACRMFQVVGSGKTRISSFSNKLYGDPSEGFDPYEYIFFKLEKPIDTPLLSDADEIVRQQYFADPDEPEVNGPPQYLYFRFLMNVNNGGDAPANEYVSGYADVSDGQYCGVWNGAGGSHFEYGWVKLKTLPADASFPINYHPIAKAGWAFSRINTPFYANNQPVPGQSSPEDFLRTIMNADIIEQLMEFFEGPNNKLRDRGFANEFVVYDDAHPEKGSSWIRLYEPDGFKLGGGHRVSRITISDNWENMESNEESFQYGQQYEYTTSKGDKSSGVASFEPMYGADENPFRIPVFYDKAYGPLIPDDRFYQEEPFGECFFPSPVVGYSRVKIMNLQRENVTKTATGYTIKEFYTAKDFPTKTSRTDLNMKRAKMDALVAIFSPYVFDFMTNSQGFCIELNDMHGKPMSEKVYQEGNPESISYVNHFYKLETDQVQKISSNLPVLEQDGDVSTREIGTEIDIVSDFRENHSLAGDVNTGFNLDYMQFGPFPILLPIIFPKIKIEETGYRSASVTKVVNRYGTEIGTEAFDLGSVVRTEDKLFNGISGEVLATQVNNEYEDDRFTVSVPAYWAYPGMGHSSNNEGFVMLSTIGNTVWNRSTGKINNINAQPPGNFLGPGDEVVRYDHSAFRMPVMTGDVTTNYQYRLWVALDSIGDYYFIDRYGQKYTTGATNDIEFKVVRSGHRNILQPKIAEFAMLEPPVTSFTSGVLDIDNSTKVLSVSAQTFHEQWKGMKRYYDCDDDSSCSCEVNAWAGNYINILGTTVSSNIIYNTGVFGDMENLKLYSPYQHGFTSVFLDYLDSITACTHGISTLDGIFLNVNGPGTTWVPLADTAFTNGHVAREVSIKFVDGAGPPCEVCGDYWLSVVNPLDVPGNYYYNPGCNDVDSIDPERIIYFPVIINSQPKMLRLADADGSSDCGTVRTCASTFNQGASFDEGDIVNPYLKNILGKWRSYQSYTLIEDRTGSTTAQVNLRDAGYIDGYSDFWHYAAGWNFASYDTVHWKRTTTMTQYHPSGPQIEEKNALDIYSSAQYGYLEQLAVAVAQNTQYKELGFDGFEDYAYLDGTLLEYTSCGKTGHFRFDGFVDNVEAGIAHTGKHSVEVTSGTPVYMERDLQPATDFRTTRNVPYVLQAKDLTEFFGPLASTTDDKKFVFSFWVNQSNYGPVMFDYTSVSGDILLNNTSILTGTVKKSRIINGWQKFEYLFTIPATSTGTLKVALIATGVTANFDDVRIHPFNGMMKSYVYDPLDLRFMAELDENNYATFYEYDEDGALVRVKKETERGIMTIQENRYGSYKY
jgi:hypothetical protein